MSSVIDPALYFKNLKAAIIKAKDKAIVEKTSEIATMSFTDLVYSITPDKAESISFKALSFEFNFDSSGELTLMELENGDVKLYALEESEMKTMVLAYVRWRAEVIAKVGI